MFKRVFLFLITNLLVLATISIVMSLLGVRPYLDAQGINYESLMIFCAIWGMGGAFISLGLSKVMAKWMMKVKIVDPNTRDQAERVLIETVQNLARGAGLPMPEVGYYQSPEVNAFATGPTKKRALVAVSTGLMQRMNRTELEGVLGHEVAHIANGDMVTMTLIQGVINAFVMFFARIAAFALSSWMSSGDERERGGGFGMQFMLVLLFDVIFGILGSIVVCYFSRQREFKADRGGATLAGRDKMIAALESLRRNHLVDNQHQAMATLKISGRPKSFAAFLLTHPPLETRIARLKQQAA